VCDKHYLINAAFVGGATPDPVGACPAFQRLPVQAAPRVPAQQQASVKTRGRSADAGIIGKPLGSWFGLTFGPAKPTVYQAFTLGPATPATPAPTPAPPKVVATKPKAKH
jgi:hypothetical protein